MGEVERMIEYSGDARHWGPDELLDWVKGKRGDGTVLGDCKKMVVIGLYDEEEIWRWDSIRCGFHASELISVLEAVKAKYVKDLNEE